MQSHVVVDYKLDFVYLLIADNLKIRYPMIILRRFLADRNIFELPGFLFDKQLHHQGHLVARRDVLFVACNERLILRNVHCFVEVKEL